MKKWIKVLGGVALSCASMWASASDPQVRSMAASCAACHGTNGVAQSGMESLAGKSKDDFVKKMLDFKNDKKPATIMHQLSKGFTDAQIEQLAGYFAALKK
jgi:cytochrome subunit of sulfide dehydrogenase